MTTPRVTVPIERAAAHRRIKDFLEHECKGHKNSGNAEEAREISDLLADLRQLSAAPVREEGGAVEAAVKIATDLHHAYEQLIYGLPKYLEAENLADEENMIREAWITLDVTAHRIAALATREKAPAEAGEADAWRIRNRHAAHPRWMVSNTLQLSSDTAHWYEVETLRVSRPSPADLDTMQAQGVAKDVIEALRAQPQAREDEQPVACLHEEGSKLPDGAISGTDDGQTVWLESSTGGAHCLGMWGGLSLRFTESDGSSVVRDYVDVKLTPPAPEAEKLRVAVEALNAIKAVRVCKESANIWTGADACRKIADQALAALKQEGR